MKKLLMKLFLVALILLPTFSITLTARTAPPQPQPITKRQPIKRSAGGPALMSNSPTPCPDPDADCGTEFPIDDYIPLMFFAGIALAVVSINKRTKVEV